MHQQQVFKLTIDNQLKYAQLCPITFRASLIWQVIEQKAEDQIVESYQVLIDEANNLSCSLLIYAIDVIMDGLNLTWNLNQHSLIALVEHKIKQQLDRTQNSYPEFIKNRFADYQSQVLVLINKIFEGLFETLEDSVMGLAKQYLNGRHLKQSLTKILDSQLQRLGYDLQDFIYVESRSLFQRLKRCVFDLLSTLYMFLYKLSYFGNCEMDTINDLMHEYTFLANIDTYKIMQIEMSKRIYRHICDHLEKQIFYRPEFHAQQSEIVYHSLRHFYHYAEWVNINFELPLQPDTFQDLNCDLDTQPQLNIQVITPSEPYQKPSNMNMDDLLSLDIGEITEGLIIFESSNDLFVQRSQNVKQVLGNHIGSVIQFRSPFDQYGLFLLIIVENQTVIKKVVNDDRWDSIQPIQFFDHLSLDQFVFLQAINVRKQIIDLSESLNHSSSFTKDHVQGFATETNRMKMKHQIQQVLTISYDEYLTNPEIHHQHIQIPKKPIRYGATTEYVAGKTLGTGLGYLIVNCLDEDMPWEDKLEDAGYTTVTWGLISVLSSRLPIVGLIIQQALLAYAVTITATNKVVNLEEKAKSLGHLAVQIGLGIVCIVGCHVLIPFHFWAAFMGGLSAGICVGLYSKFVIPDSLASLKLMIEKMERRINNQGYLYYSPVVVNIMKIKESFFLNTKPEGLSKSDWLTMTIVCLVNEFHYMYQLLLAKQIEKVTKKIESKPQNQQLYSEMEELKILWIKNDICINEWKDCRKYLQVQKLSILTHYKLLQQFLQGMIENFKIP